jgi:transketolase
VPLTRPDFRLGRAIRLRDGRDATLISTGGMLAHTLEAAERLAGEHQLQCRVLSMHTLKPLDVDATLAAARETGAIVTVEEHSITGGLGSAVAEVLAESDASNVRFRRFGAPDAVNRVVGSQSFLRARCGSLVELVSATCRPAGE